MDKPVGDSNRKDGEAPEIPFKRFSLCDDLGFLAPCCSCCSNKKPTKMAQQIGLGPTLFLMSTKAFAWFFLVITIINIPVLMFFGMGN